MSRKLLIITFGVTVFLGGTGVTALYFGGKDLIMEDGASAVGAECIDIQTMVLKTPSNHLWLRRFIRMENATGQERVRTALRIAGLLAQKNAVDLVHVSVLDTNGPDKRAFMRERAIGAEVLIALKPENLPEMKSPAMASYYEGPVSAEGRFYGDKVIVDLDEIRSMMTAMRTVAEKPDCTVPVNEAEEAAKANEHGAKDKKEGGSEHGAKPEETHGEKPAEDAANAHGEKPAEEAKTENAHGEEPAKEQSFLDSMMSMVGLGGSEEAPKDGKEPAPDAAGKKDHGADPSASKSSEHEAKPEDQAAAEPADKAQAEEPAQEQSFVDSMLGMVGLGSDEAAEHKAPAVDPAEAVIMKGAEDHQSADHEAAQSEDPGKEPAVKDAATSHEEAPAEEPAQIEDHAKPTQTKSDEHADAEKPAGH